jgi:hypothetical protein
VALTLGAPALASSDTRRVGAIGGASGAGSAPVSDRRVHRSSTGLLTLSARWRTRCRPGGGVQHCGLTCGHDCIGSAGRRFCEPVARRTKTVTTERTPGSLRRRFRTAGPGAGPPVVEDGVLVTAPLVVEDPGLVTPAPTAPPVQQASTAAAAAGSGEALRAPARRPKPPDGTAMLLVDLRASLMLLNEARCRTIENVFGVPREQVNLTTGILALVLADTIHTRAQKLKPSRRPTVADAAIGVGALRESIYGVAGPASRDTPLVGTLIALAILGGLVRPGVARSIHGMKASSRRMHTMFLGRYGHLVGHHRRDR